MMDALLHEREIVVSADLIDDASIATCVRGRRVESVEKNFFRGRFYSPSCIFG